MTSKAEKAKVEAEEAAAEKAYQKGQAAHAAAAPSKPPAPPISLDDAVIEGANGARFVVEGLAAGFPRLLVLDERQYEHVSEDDHGRWVYRA